MLRSICEKGINHIGLDEKLKQFAVYNLHRDSFDTTPKWISGDAKVNILIKYNLN